MRRMDPRRVRACLALAAISALAAAGASPLKKKTETVTLKTDETLGDLAYVATATDVKLEGVGLVVGLDDTGVDPPPSYHRQKLVDDMRKAGVEKANELLKNPRVAAVIVRMVVPSGITPRDRIDVEVEPLPGSATKSLAGGYLLETRLREIMVLGGVPKEGNDAAFAQGPVMTGVAADPSTVKAGRVLGGGRVRKEIPHKLVLKENRKSVRVSALVEAVVNQRFPQSEGVDQKGSAHAKTDQYLVLRVPRVYHQNQERFFRVVKLLPLVESPALRAQRLAEWSRQLLEPTTAGVAALRLEGLGISAADVLKTGLASANAQVRFFAAEALAYLNDPAGADVLGDTAAKIPEFRTEALAALAAMDQPVSHIKLRKLMDEPDAQVRYGAFNALRTLSRDDPFLGQVRVLRDPTPQEDEAPPESMAAAIASARRAPRRDDPFALYIVDCEGPPMVHVANTRRCEVVVFGRGMKLMPPVVLGQGSILLNAAESDQELQISKIIATRASDGDEKVSSSFELGDVLREAANLGASYPDIVALLQAADRQKNLPGPLVLDAVPTSRTDYIQAAFLGRDATKKDAQVGAAKAQPAEPSGRGSRLRNLFNRRGNDAKVDPAVQTATSPAPASAASPNATPPGVSPDSTAGKKDPAVTKASGAPVDSGAPRRRSLLERFRDRVGND